MIRTRLSCLTLLAATSAAIAATEPASLVEQLGSPDVAVRESAIRALQNRKDATAAVVAAIAGDDLNRRLGAMELLETWGAPTAGIDPWEKSSLTPQRLESLKSWAATVEQVGPATQPTGAMEAEISRLVDAADEALARVITERIVRFGEPAVGLLAGRLEGIGPGEIRRRLTAARYRICVADARLKASPDLVDQLTSRDSAARSKAMSQLLASANAADARLLQELFSDPDPLIREQALLALRKIGGNESNQVLVHLLADPDANVRAAVLKALGEEGAVDPTMAASIQKYVQTETDADLIGHAIRVLKVMPGEASAAALEKLLSHADWRVRAEALEAITPKLRPSYGDKPLAAELLVSINTQVVKMLDDPEPFVVSRAMQAVQSSRAMPITVLIQTIERKPDIAPQLLEMMEDDSDVVTAGAPQVKPLMTHERPAIRAAAVRFVSATRNATYAQAVRDALDDNDANVRTEAIKGIFGMVNSLQPRGGYIETAGFMGFGRKREKVDVGKWVESFRSGKEQPAWLKSAAEKIEKLFPTLEGEPHAVAAVVLVAVGRDEIAYEPLKKLAAAPGTAVAVVPALAWVPETQRIELFQLLNASVPDDEKYDLFQLVARFPSTKLKDLLWTDLASRSDIDDGAARLIRALESQYGGEYGNDWHMVPDADRTAAIKEIETRAGSGSEIQRAAALQLLYELDQAAAIRVGRSIYTDASQTPSTRRDAFQVVLVSHSGSEDANSMAVEGLKDENVRELAVRFLAAGVNAIQGGAANTRPFKQNSFYRSYSSVDKPLVLPEGVKSSLDLIRPYTASKDEALAAYAAYLMVAAGEKDHFKTLEAAWTKSGDIADSPYTDLVVRAIAFGNDASKVPLLERIYEAQKADSNYRVRELYWTIRPMTGPEILALRKRMRAEVGMDNLRQY